MRSGVLHVASHAIRCCYFDGWKTLPMDMPTSSSMFSVERVMLPRCGNLACIQSIYNIRYIYI